MSVLGRLASAPISVIFHVSARLETGAISQCRRDRPGADILVVRQLMIAADTDFVCRARTRSAILKVPEIAAAGRSAPAHAPGFATCQFRSWSWSRSAHPLFLDSGSPPTHGFLKIRTLVKTASLHSKPHLCSQNRTSAVFGSSRPRDSDLLDTEGSGCADCFAVVRVVAMVLVGTLHGTGSVRRFTANLESVFH